MQEIWKDVVGYEGLYQVSNMGRVKSFCQSTKFHKQKEFILKPSLINTGYEVVTLYSKEKRKKFQIHRLVATAFIPNPNNLPCVNHKDENKENNSVENLEWCDYVYNSNYGTGIERSKEKRLGNKFVVINLDTGEVYQTPKDASRATGIHNDSISKVCKGKSKTAGGYRWRYLNE